MDEMTTNNRSIDFLVNLLNTCSPSGYEKQPVEVVNAYLNDYCNTETDSMGNLYAYTGCNKGMKVMITAHCDEVGFQITAIDSNGYAFVRKIGGLDRHTLPGTKVSVITEKGEIVGVFGKKSPHVQNNKEREQILEIEDMWIDLGFSSDEEAKKVIAIGDYVTAKSGISFTHNGKKIISKALDNKIGVYIMAEVMKALSSMDLCIEVVGVATVQEEIGCRGSIIATQRVSPDLAFCIDVGIATDIPNMTEKSHGKFELGGGPGICKNADNNEKLIGLIRKVAGSHDIPYQDTIGFRPSGGTETARIQLLNGGVITANISIPNRYMHSVVEMCDLDDANNAISLLINSIIALQEKNNKDFNLFE